MKKILVGICVLMALCVAGCLDEAPIVEDEITDNSGRIQALEARMDSLEARVELLEDDRPPIIPM